MRTLGSLVLVLSMAVPAAQAQVLTAQHLFDSPTRPTQPVVQPVTPPQPEPVSQPPLISTPDPMLQPAQQSVQEFVAPAGDPNLDIPTVPIVPSSGNAPTDLQVLPELPITNNENASIEEIINSSRELNRAKNLARQAAEIHNGGLQNYRAEPAMHTAGIAAPYVDRGDHWVFRFQGGAPGATMMTVESEIRVDKGTFQTAVLYNGSIRP